MLKRSISLIAGMALLTALATPFASATTRTGTMSVTATQSTPCTVTKNANLSFGTNDFAEGAPINESQGVGGHPGDLTLACGDDNTTVSFDNGQNFSGGMRHMANGSALIGYKLCQAEPTTDCTDWNSSNMLSFADGSAGETQDVKVFGLVPDGSQNDQSDGNYSDVVTYTVSVNL
jgi:spore coat protein U-like protein